MLLLGFGYYNSNSQNLIANGSFENYSSLSCTSTGFDDYTVVGTPHILDNWYTLNSSDYFRAVCNNNYVGVPVNKFGYCLAHDGSAYVGFETVYNNSETKEYIYQQLNSPLQAGKSYCLSFYVSRSDRVSYAIKNIGAYFSNNVQPLNGLGYISAIPQVVNQSGFLTDTTSWTLVQDCYTAIGGEQYLTIGNFNSNADTLRIQSLNPLSTTTVDIAYYYIDDVTLIDQTTVDVKNMSDELGAMSVYPNPNDGVMQLNYNITKKAELLITDITGRVINNYMLDETQKSITIKEQELNAGIYFYTVKQNNHILKQDKLIIIK
jgi:hypothetical protein